MPTTGRASPLSIDILASRLGKLAPLADHERNVLRLIEGRPRHTHDADTRLITEGRPLRMPHFIVTGWACRMRELKDGRRQILSLLLPGDAIGLSLRQQAVSPTTIMSL